MSRNRTIESRIILSTLAGALAGLGACADLGPDGEPYADEDIAAQSASLTDFMGSTKQNGFGTRTQILADLCAAGQTCDVAELNGDTRDDLVAINTASRQIRYARSNSTGGWTVAVQPFDAARPGRLFAWGRANDDARADLFMCDTATGVAQVFDMTATGLLSLTPRAVGTNFCRPGEQMRVAHVGGSTLDDVVRFHMSATAPHGQVKVAINTGSGFAAPTVWHGFFGINNEQVRVADLTGDGVADLVTCVPDGGAWVAPNRRTSPGFVPSVQPPVGVPGTARPVLTDLARTGQTCLTGNFDAGTRHDLVVFAQGVGGMIDDFTDSRGDVYVALANIDFLDGLRLGFGQPRIRHQDFCRAGEQCAVGDFDGDGIDDLASFARGSDGTNRVFMARSTFRDGRSWTLDLTRIRARVTEGTGDKPLILALNFRSTVGRRGSTVITRNAYNETFAQGIVAGGSPITIPANVGEATFAGVRLRTIDNLTRAEDLEILGTVVIVMEKDLSAAAAYSGLMDEATRALTEALQIHVERRSVISLLTDGLDVSMADLEDQLGHHVDSALDDILHLVITGLFDPDDFINVQLAIFPALDKEIPVTLLDDDTTDAVHTGVPGEGLFGPAFGTMIFQDTDSPLRYDIDVMLR